MSRRCEMWPFFFQTLQKFKICISIFILYGLMQFLISDKEMSTDDDKTERISISAVAKTYSVEEILGKFDISIAFFFISGPRVITGITNCCVISAARHHPNNAIIVFVHSRMKTPLNWKKYKNIFTLKLSEEDLLRNTPLEKWHSNGTWRQSSLWDYHLGDALRLGYLWKYGGAYLDIDVIVLRNFLEPFNNCLAFENEENSAIDGAILIFDKAHPFINLAMNKFVDEFQDTWAYQGPSLMWRTFEMYKSLQLDSLASLNVLNSTTFYPVSWKNLEIKKLYQSEHLQWALDKIKNSWTIHLWNKASKNFLLEKGSLLDELMTKQCK